MTTNAFMDSSARLRSVLEKRREKSTTTDLKRIPLILDQSLADDVDQIARQRQAVEERLAYLQDAASERDPDDPSVDVRGSGHDVSAEGQAIAAAEAELERLTAELTAATEVAREAVVQLVFRRADAEDYERLIIAAGGLGVDSDADASFKFHESLAAHCFVRVEIGGEDAKVGTWADFRAVANLSFGEVDPIRSLVWAMNRRGGNSVPFSLAPSKQTPNS